MKSSHKNREYLKQSSSFSGQPNFTTDHVYAFIFFLTKHRSKDDRQLPEGDNRLFPIALFSPTLKNKIKK